MMINQVPGISGLKLTTPSELVHNAKPKSNTWFELFSICYFNRDTDNTKSWSKLQAHTLDGITVGGDDMTNSIIFYNTITTSYYRPPDFWLDKSRLLITNLPNSLHFDGGLTCGLLCNNTDPIHKPFLPGTHVSIQHDYALARGTIRKIPIPVSPILKCAAPPPPEKSDDGYISTELPESPLYVILLKPGKNFNNPLRNSSRWVGMMLHLPS